jgi:parallel beta-helix repeat protein
LIGQAVRLQPGQVLTSSAKVLPGVYAISDSGHIKVKGHGIVIDFAGATLLGSRLASDPDQRAGTGLEVSGDHITIRNLKVRGYKVGLLAKNVPGLKLENCDFSYNWAPRLKSTAKKEDESDWMSYHHNDNDEWLRYGAGVYLEGCDNFEVKQCKANGGQNGLMLTKSNHGRVVGCDFSFLSGIGIGLYRSSYNQIQQNKVDYCVRGYSYGVYYRGQDSAGILVYEQSSHNLFAYNSVTHGGDGFFLWAGQSTMDTGQGGCNDNLIYGNDFSHAVTNGIEATFSRNAFINNLSCQCWHGIWGGYSYDSLIQGNTFIGNLSGVAIEHGQNNTISENDFIHNRVDLELWANPETDPTWGYPKHRDTASHGYRIWNNRFYGNGNPDVSIRNTSDAKLDRNLGHSIPGQPDLTSVPAVPDGAQPQPAPIYLQKKPTWNPGPEFATDLATYPEFAKWSPTSHLGIKPGNRIDNPPPIISGIPMPFIPKGQARGRDTILIDEWGPYDSKSPKLVLKSSKGIVRQFEVLGPKGTQAVHGHWSLDAVENGRMLDVLAGPAPAKFQVADQGQGAHRFRVAITWTGMPSVDRRGAPIPWNQEQKLTYSVFIPDFHWNVGFYKWDKTTDPRTQPDAFAKLLEGQPIVTTHPDSLAFGGGQWAAGVPSDYFALKAETPFQFPEGLYDLELTADDGARVFLDDVLVPLLDADNKPAESFKYQVPTAYHTTLQLDDKPHKLRVEYFQIDGGKTLNFSLTPRK